LPGIALIAVAALAYLRRSVRLWKEARARDRDVKIARMASVVIALMALASLTDYPVRTPIMMSVLALCCLWLVEPGRDRADRRDSAGMPD
jgi:uncharacterized membrane protein YbaN (DUF454 family)